ncbi:methyltransferase [Myxococcaceae bacterium GXIMD 01537]
MSSPPSHPSTPHENPPAASAAPPVPPQAVLLGMMIDGLILSRGIGTAAELGLADAVARGPMDTAELAKATGTHPDALSRLMRMLMGAGLFAQDAQGRYVHTPLSEPLRSDVPGSLHGWASYMGHDWYWQVWSFLPQTIRNGLSIHENVHQQRFFEWYRGTPEYSRAFDSAMTSFSAIVNPAIVAGLDLTGIKTLVDVAGGQGTLLANILASHPQVSGALFDTREVLDSVRASESLGALVRAGRMEFIEGDIFKSLPPGRDAYLLKWILHDWRDDEALRILKLLREAMGTTRGKLLIAEMVMPDGPGPSMAKPLDIGMLALTGGRERTVAEYGELLAQAGFKLTRVVPTPSPFSIVEAVPA